MFGLRILVSIFFCLSLISVSSAQNLSQETGIKKLIEDVSVDTQKGAIFNYTYQLEVSYAKKNKLGFGRKFTKTYKAVIPSRFDLNSVYTHPLVLVKDSEKLITREDIDNDIKDLVEKIDRAERAADNSTEEEAESNGGYWTMRLKANKEYIKIDILKIFEIARFSNLQEKQIDGNNLILLDFSPNPALIFDESLDYISDIEGQIWIDPTSNRVVRVEGFPLGTFAEMRNQADGEREDKAIFLFVQKKVSEGFWFPDYVRLDFTDNPKIFKPIRLEFKFSDYQKSNTNVRNVNIKTPQESEATSPEIEPESDEKDN